MSDDVKEKSARTIDYKLRTIYFYLTKGCNLHCRHCWIAPEFQTDGKIYPSLQVKQFTFILDQAMPLGLSSVKFTGGEPLLHPDIKRLLEIVKEKDLRCSVETNGVLCTQDLAALIASCKNSFVAVSLDGADADTHEWVRGVRGSFDAAVAGIKNLVVTGLRPQVIMTVMKRNKEQMADLVRLAESLGAGSVKFNILQPTARGAKMHENDQALDISELVSLGRWVETELSNSTTLSLIYGHPVAFRPLSEIYGNSRRGWSGCAIFSILGVLADGSYALCGIGENVPELKFGHVETDRLKDVWRNTPVLKEIRDRLPGELSGICSNCLMKTQCLGQCVAQNYSNSKDLLASFWYCTKARKRGIFPETRLIS